jgi:hypothetical protein
MVKRAPARRRPLKAKSGTKGLGPAECRLEQLTASASEAAEAIAESGSCVVGSYLDRTRSRSAGTLSCSRFCRSMPSSPLLSNEISSTLITNGPRMSSTKRAFSRPDHRSGHAEGRLLDSQRPSSPRSHAPPWSEIKHCARRGRARGILAVLQCNQQPGAGIGLQSLHVHGHRPASG